MTALLVFLGGCLGAVARYAVDHLIHRRCSRRFPWGTLAVNAMGSALLGIVAGAASSSSTNVVAFVATGFCGALTTYSTFSYETIRLLTNRAPVRASLNIGVSVAGGLTCLAFGYAIGVSLAH